LTVQIGFNYIDALSVIFIGSRLEARLSVSADVLDFCYRIFILVSCNGGTTRFNAACPNLMKKKTNKASRLPWYDPPPTKYEKNSP
jgi:hypothetical protein